MISSHWETTKDVSRPILMFALERNQCVGHTFPLRGVFSSPKGEQLLRIYQANKNFDVHDFRISGNKQRMTQSPIKEWHNRPN